MSGFSQVEMSGSGDRVADPEGPGARRRALRLQSNRHCTWRREPTLYFALTESGAVRAGLTGSTVGRLACAEDPTSRRLAKPGAGASGSRRAGPSASRCADRPTASGAGSRTRRARCRACRSEPSSSSASAELWARGRWNPRRVELDFAFEAALGTGGACARRQIGKREAADRDRDSAARADRPRPRRAPRWRRHRDRPTRIPRARRKSRTRSGSSSQRSPTATGRPGSSSAAIAYSL